MKRPGLLLGFLLIAILLSSINFLTAAGASIRLGNTPEGEHPKVLLVSSMVDSSKMLARAASEEVIVIRYNPSKTSLDE